MNWRDYWDKYLWIAAMFVLAMFVLVSLYGRGPFCGPDEHCLREWISALSGWIAAFAAFLTLMYLRDESRRTQENHRQLLTIEVQPKIALSQSVSLLAGAALRSVETYRQVTTRFRSNSGVSDEFYFSEATRNLKSLKNVLDESDLVEFQRHLGSNQNLKLRIVKTSVKRLLEAIDEADPKNRKFATFAAFFDERMDQVSDYFEYVQVSADGFVSVWEDAINQNR